MELTNSALLRKAKKSKMTCSSCKSSTWTANGRPIFGNGINDAKIAKNGEEYCSRCAAKLVASGEIELYEIPEWTEPDRVSDYGEKYDFCSDLNERDVFYAYSGNNVHVRHRCMREETTIFVFGHGKSKYGRRYSINSFCENFDLSIKTRSVNDDEDTKWHKRIRRAIMCLESSGLWPDLLEKLRNLDTMTLADKKAIHDIYWEETGGRHGLSAKYDEYKKKYPFVFAKGSDGNDYVVTFYIWEQSEVKLKSMYFGRANKHVKELIKKALVGREKYSVRQRVSYDVSFAYDPDKNAAWYSEEYRNCGNGHYYIALDENTAWFCEND